MLEDIVVSTPRIELGTRAEARTKEAERFIALQADWLLSCDSDQTIPVEALGSFLNIGTGRISNRADIYIIDAPNKGQDDTNVFYHPDGTLAYFTISCCLIHKSVFEQLEKPWFSSKHSFIERGTKNGKKLWEIHEKLYDDNINEDVYFSRKCLENSIRIEIIPNIKSKHMEL